MERFYFVKKKSSKDVETWTTKNVNNELESSLWWAFEIEPCHRCVPKNHEPPRTESDIMVDVCLLPKSSNESEETRRNSIKEYTALMMRDFAP